MYRAGNVGALRVTTTVMFGSQLSISHATLVTMLVQGYVKARFHTPKTTQSPIDWVGSLPHQMSAVMAELFVRHW